MHPIDIQLNEMLHGNFEEGWKISEKLEKLGQDKIPDRTGNPNPEMWLRHCFNRGWFKLQRGDYQEGSQLLESGRFLNVYGSPVLDTTKPLWDGTSSLEGKTIILSMEGGYGDEIIHARFATEFANRGAEVIIACDPTLHSAFSRIPGVKKCITRAEPKETYHDYWLPGFSCGWVLGFTYDTLPSDQYIFPHPTSVSMWGSIIKSDKIKVGIRWSGNPKFEHQQFRLFDAQYLVDLAKHEELEIYSLQRDNDIRELPSNVTDLQHLLISWEDTIAAIQNLDLVITSCTSIAHLAGAMNKETWVILPILPYHIWAKDAPNSTTSPWYKNVRLFRQKTFGKWDDTFAEVYDALIEKYNLKVENKMKDIKIDLPGPGESLDVTDIMESFKQKKAEYVPYAPKFKKSSMAAEPVFIAGLPRSGQWDLASLLANHKNICHINDGYGYFNKAKKAFKDISTYNKKSLFVNSVIDFYNLEIDDWMNDNKNIAIDVNYNWNDVYSIDPDIFGNDFKIIAMVRNPADILASYEVNRRKKIVDIDFVDYDNQPEDDDSSEDKIGPTILEDRCFKIANSNGMMGRHHALLTNAIITGKKKHILFVEYNKLFNEPQKQCDRIFEFLEIESQELDKGDIDSFKTGRESFVTVDILGLDLFQQYNNPTQIFWRDWV